MSLLKTLTVMALVCLAVPNVYSQAVGVGTITPDGSAKLDISSTDKGLLIPRMTTIQRNAIATLKGFVY